MKSVITQKFQVHIPASVRKVVGLTPNSKVSVRAEGKKVIIEPTNDSILDLAGAFSVENPIQAEEIRKQLFQR